VCCSVLSVLQYDTIHTASYFIYAMWHTRSAAHVVQCVAVCCSVTSSTLRHSVCTPFDTLSHHIYTYHNSHTYTQAATRRIALRLLSLPVSTVLRGICVSMQSVCLCNTCVSVCVSYGMCVCCVFLCANKGMHMNIYIMNYAVATVSRIYKITGLFCRI